MDLKNPRQYELGAHGCKHPLHHCAARLLGYLAAGYALDFKFDDDAPLIAGIVRTAE